MEEKVPLRQFLEVMKPEHIDISQLSDITDIIYFSSLHCVLDETKWFTDNKLLTADSAARASEIHQMCGKYLEKPNFDQFLLNAGMTFRAFDKGAANPEKCKALSKDMVIRAFALLYPYFLQIMTDDETDDGEGNIQKIPREMGTYLLQMRPMLEKIRIRLAYLLEHEEDQNSCPSDIGPIIDAIDESMEKTVMLNATGLDNVCLPSVFSQRSTGPLEINTTLQYFRILHRNRLWKSRTSQKELRKMLALKGWMDRYRSLQFPSARTPKKGRNLTLVAAIIR